MQELFGDSEASMAWVAARLGTLMAVASPMALNTDTCNLVGAWYAVQVRTCREKVAAAFLTSEGFACFLPLGKVRRRWSDRVKVLEQPLFPGYLFCRFDSCNRLPVLKTPGVIQIVGIGKTPVPVADDEVAALQSLDRSGLAAQPWSFLQVGHTARIECGPLRGLTGVIIRVKSEFKLVLSVTLLQRSVAVEVDGHWLSCPEAVETSAIPMGTSTVGSSQRVADHPSSSALDQRARGARGWRSLPLWKGGLDVPQDSGAD